MLKTELWGHFSLLLWYSNNWGSPKFALLFMEKEQKDIAAPEQPLLAQAEWIKAHGGPGDAQRNMTWHTQWPYLCSSTKARELCCAPLHQQDCHAPGGAMLGLPCCRMMAEPECLGNPPLREHPCLQGTHRVAQALPASSGGSCLCCEMNFLTKKQSFLSCNPRLMSQHFTHQLFTTKSKKSNFKIL